MWGQAVWGHAALVSADPAPGARAFRRHISENAPRQDAGVAVIREAMALVPGETELV